MKSTTTQLLVAVASILVFALGVCVLFELAGAIVSEWVYVGIVLSTNLLLGGSVYAWYLHRLRRKAHCGKEER